MNKVSVIVPVYNVEKYLNKCLDSIINQTYKNLEIILIDDGSIDNSGEICEEYAQIDNRIIVIHNKNQGVSKSRLDGFYLSKGKYIMFVDSDDYLDLKMIEVMINNLEKYNVDVVICQYYEIVNNDIKKAKIRPDRGFYDKEKIIDLLKNGYLYDKKIGMGSMNHFLWSKLIKRNFVSSMLETGLNLYYSEDEVANIEMLYDINSMYVLDKYLYYYNQSRNGQVTKRYDNNFWRNLENFVVKVRKTDKENCLIIQLSTRLLLAILEHMNLAEKKGGDIKNIIEYIKNNTKLFFIIKMSDLSFKNKIKFFLLKNKMYNLYKFLRFIK